MELRHLRYFLAVAEKQHFSRAAVALHITQPTLSQQIRQLEDELGTPLFDRLGRRVRLTVAGKIFETYAKRALLEIRWGKKQIDELQNLQHGNLRLGVIHTFNTSLVPPAAASFYAKYPAIHLAIEEGPARVIEQDLINGDLDLGIAFAPAILPDIEAERLFREEFVLVVRAGHDLAAVERMSFAELAGIPLILVNRRMATRRMIDRFFVTAGVEPSVSVEASTIEVIMQIISRCDLASIIPERVPLLQSGCYHTIRLTQPTPTRCAALLHHKHSYRSAAVEAFIRIFKGFLLQK